mgnify:CR=1 FL=1
MIAQLTGSVVERFSDQVVLDVGGVGFLLGVSATTAAQLPEQGSSDVTLYTRLLVRESAMELYGFSSRDERAVFDRLVAVSGVGPKLALAILSVFTPATLATIVRLKDASRLSQVPGVGRKKVQRLLVELQDGELRDLVGADEPSPAVPGPSETDESIVREASSALLSMGFTSQEIERALEGRTRADADTLEKTLSYALRRLGGGS